MDQDETWQADRPRSDIVLNGDWGPSCPFPKEGAEPPIFGPCLLWPNRWMDVHGTWHGGGPRSRPKCARWRPSSPPQKRGHSPQFSAHVCCGQTAGWIKMRLGTKVGLGSGCIVLHGDATAPSQMGHRPPIFGPCLLWPNSRPSQLLLSSCTLVHKY